MNKDYNINTSQDNNIADNLGNNNNLDEDFNKYLEKDLNKLFSKINIKEYITNSNIDKAINNLESLGWQKELIGYSSLNKEIYSLNYNKNKEKKIFAYSFPHPDENLGATSLYNLALLLTEDNYKILNQINYSFIFNPDPDNVIYNSWLNFLNREDLNPKEKLSLYLNNYWHPEFIKKSIDYQFPIKYRYFYNPKDDVLTESQNIANWLQVGKPDILALMHNEHISGSYTFLNFKPTKTYLKQVDDIHHLNNISNHIGEIPDIGYEKIFNNRDDYFYEYSLNDEIDRLSQEYNNIENKLFSGTVSVAQYLESLEYQTKIITPEIGLFNYDSYNLLSDKNLIKVKIKIKNNYIYLYSTVYINTEKEILIHKLHINNKNLLLNLLNYDDYNKIKNDNNLIFTVDMISTKGFIFNYILNWQEYILDYNNNYWTKYQKVIEEKLNKTLNKELDNNFIENHQIELIRDYKNKKAIIEEEFRKLINSNYIKDLNYLKPLDNQYFNDINYRYRLNVLRLLFEFKQILTILDIRDYELSNYLTKELNNYNEIVLSDLNKVCISQISRILLLL